jgi:hypothetical protein
MHRLWQKAAADLTVEQVNHHERSGVLPITFSLLHFVRGEDNNISKLILNEPTIWESGNWREKIGSTVDEAPRGTPMAVSEGIRFSDMDAWRAYQTSVFERTEATLAGGSIDWDRDLYGGALPPAMEGSFLWHMLGPDEIPKLVDGIEGFIYQHGIRHLGEIEHARALVGLGGTS